MAETLEGFHSDKNNLKNKIYKTGVVEKSRPKHILT